MNDWENLPSQKELSRVANWRLITVVAVAVAAGVPIGLRMLVPDLPFAALMVIFGVLLIPVFVTFGITVRHVVRSLKLRNAEQREGRIVYKNRLGAFIDQHTYVLAFVVIGGSLLVALIWALLDPR